MGRVDRRDASGPRLAWPGTGVLARVRGTRIDVRLKDAGENRFAVMVDGKGPKLIKTGPGSLSYELATGLSDGEHDVEIYKRTEVDVGVVQFLGFVQPAVVTPPPHVRTIEFIGDSITAGYGIDVAADFNCPLAADEDAYSSYAAIAARRLKAAYALVAWSARGMLRNWSGETKDTMPELWERTLGNESAHKWDFSTWTPDLVVVALGTNDYAMGDPGEPFGSKYAAFLGKVRSRYPAAWVLCATSPMLTGASRESLRTRVRGVVEGAKSKGDAKIAVVDFAEQINTDGNGCAGHPSSTTHRKMADQLVLSTHSTIGW